MSDWDTNSHGRGYSGAAFDQQVGRTEKSPLEKFKEQFWTAKQVVLQKLGKKEDQHLIASDAELDAKLELYSSIKISSGGLMRIANRYQKEMHELSKEEYAMGLFLKRHGEQDPSRAGMMLGNVAKALVISAQKRMEARAPLIRLAQDARTYRRCAVTDTESKIEQMEEARTEYRGALLWMKDVSEELDPDTFRKLEKFRKVQSQVRAKKEKFDCNKLDTLQKIDLLAISRLNMLSQSLTPYGTSMNDFHEKVAAVLSAVVIPGHNPNEAELGLLQHTGANKATSHSTQSVSKDDDALLDLSGDAATANQVCPASSSELLDAFWKESGLENNNFDPLSAAMDGLSFESSEVNDRQDQSPENNPLAGLFDFSELDETEKGNMGFFAGDTLQPAKSFAAEQSSSKDAPTGYKAFLPSQLLKKGWTSSLSSPTVPSKPEAGEKTAKSKAWQDLFADLDPLTNQSASASRRTDGKEEEGSC
ncbi:islet cell autoantigen 1-like protein [Paramacrobiotus metropolitanus]|uniref:islet cell autoantigen 1-like protein n=1 Tax=Paramacrobiotus metropolitanus TaxID=2943436 RepID=UPI0024464994|nr:islet cell autoantigen 1-like protein [Paramacrobiotus metropolitanus]